MESDNQQIIALLTENNQYIKELLQIKKQEHRTAKIDRIVHLVITLAPWIALIIIGYFIWQSIMHYLDTLNQNINTLKSNFDTLTNYFKNLIPDFSSIQSQLKNAWNNIHF